MVVKQLNTFDCLFLQNRSIKIVSKMEIKYGLFDFGVAIIPYFCNTWALVLKKDKKSLKNLHNFTSNIFFNANNS